LDFLQNHAISHHQEPILPTCLGTCRASIAQKLIKTGVALHVLLDAALSDAGLPLSYQYTVSRDNFAGSGVSTQRQIFYNSRFRMSETVTTNPAETMESSAKSGPLDINQIQAILPHRYPFLLIDRVLEIERKKKIVAIKNVTINEPFFAGHFPGFPIMPGVLIVEAMAQAGGALLLTEVEDRSGKLIVFTGIEKARFRRPVVPGDQLRLEVEMLSWKAIAGIIAV